MATLPPGLQPYISPVPEALHYQLASLMFIVGFVLFSLLFIYQITNPKEARSLTREVLISMSISVLWGFAALFGMLTAGIYV
ncbi:hypothetical protein SteCoe_18503 [Stentor coeruleus]|uniref:Dolichyl-diphosphooligosaccharide-protein glycosyltransferase subunit OST5 n=1 Tax=Stentor coeruleus TaxID=5963 RepID=A0A1R2BW86_9CILI|nr:hypothetical protein SteCoe_18503 [Stentor coeruleus]